MMMKTTDVAALRWNDAWCLCYHSNADDLDDCYDQHLIECYDEKVDELSDRFLDSIMDIGVKTPVSLRDDRIYNGHHRLVAALLLGIEEIPVTFDYLDQDETLPDAFDDFYPDDPCTCSACVEYDAQDS